MMNGFKITLVVLALSVAVFGQARAHEEIEQSLVGAEKLGSANVGFLGFRFYKAELWTEGRAPFDFEEPFALALTYERHISRGDMLTTTVKELARIEGRPEKDFYPVRSVLRPCLAGVAPGDRITGANKGADGAEFYFNGEKSCTIDDPELMNQFFSIWLGEKTRDRRARRRLLGTEG